MKRVILRERSLISGFTCVGVLFQPNDNILLYTDEVYSDLDEFPFEYLDKPYLRYLESKVYINQEDLDYIKNNPGGNLYKLGKGRREDFEMFKKTYEEEV